jgi:iron-sulfur cluster assembly accessory protein
MITMSDQAASELLRLLRARNLTDHGLRIAVCAGGCAGLQYELAFECTERKGDTVTDVQGVRLYVDPFSARFLEGARLGWLDTSAGTGFRVENPNASVTCACGASFRVESGQVVAQASQPVQG